jgi:hypothetical protein
VTKAYGGLIGNGCGANWNRDRNAVNNMMVIANSHFNGNGRPQQYVLEPQQRDAYDDAAPT